MIHFGSVLDFESRVGQELGTSGWLTVDQARIDAFAECTGDRQWIHVDPVRAADSPFGSAIAHGFLTLALLPALADEVYEIVGARMILNYGLNKVRFLAPVPVGSRLRTSTVLRSASRIEGGLQVQFDTTFEIDGRDRPVAFVEGLQRVFFD